MIKNERGSLLVYTIFLILVISVLTLPLLNISSARDIANIHDHNQKIANSLALSIAEDYLAYLQPCIGYVAPDADDEDYVYDEIDILCSDPDYYKQSEILNNTTYFTLPDGTAVSYSTTLENNNQTIVFHVVAGDSDRNNIANEKFANSKTIKYDLFASTVEDNRPPASFIDPNNNVIPIPSNVYFGNGQIPPWMEIPDNPYNIDYRMRDWPGEIYPYDGPPIQPSLISYMDYLNTRELNMVDAKKQEYTNHPNEVTCTSDCTFSKIMNIINNHPNKNPLVIKASKFDLNLSTNYTIGSSSQKVVLVADNNMAINNSAKLTLYGDIVVNNEITSYNNPKIELHGDLIARKMSASGGFQLNQGLSTVPNSNIWITEKLNVSNTSKIHVSNSFYAGDFHGNNGSYILAKEIIVKNKLSGHNNTINAKERIVVGTVDITSSYNFISQEGDFFTVYDFNTTNSDHFKIGGSIAIGGTLKLSNAPTTFSIGYQYNADGTLKLVNGQPVPGISILNPVVLDDVGDGDGGGSGGSGGSGNSGGSDPDKTLWKPVRKK